MEKPIIEIRSISKKYDIAHMRGGYIALRDVLANIARHPFSFMAKRARRAVGLEKKEEFWALKDVSFSVKRGEVVGVVGANGAGKSTLLKILSQITPPTDGEVVIRGRLGSLLEVGTGFHPELTGRENIFLNGAILGMKKREIARKFDEIVAFAGIERFLDTPVKHYSSGMYVRLAFSVAAHMEPDILLVDEVLAVGDAEFQKKCLGKMDEITKMDGRTILFVSHNMTAIRSLCKRCIVLEKGKKIFDGDTESALNEYNNRQTSEITINRGGKSAGRRGSGTLSFTKIEILDDAGAERNLFTVKETVSFRLSYKALADMQGLHAKINLYSTKTKGEILTDIKHEIRKGSIKNGDEGVVTIEVDLTAIRPGEYILYFWIGDADAVTQGTPTNYDVIDGMTKPLIVKAKDENAPTSVGSFSLPSRVLRS